MTDKKVVLDVGGVKFVTRESTLIKAPYFEVLIHNFECTNVNDILYPEFIDRDPEAFKYILNHLRDSRYEVPDKYLPDMDYYGIITNKIINLFEG